MSLWQVEWRPVTPQFRVPSQDSLQSCPTHNIGILTPFPHLEGVLGRTPMAWLLLLWDLPVPKQHVLLSPLLQACGRFMWSGSKACLHGNTSLEPTLLGDHTVSHMGRCWNPNMTVHAAGWV